MKKGILILAIIIAIVAVVLIVINIIPGETVSKVEGVDLSTETGGAALIEKIYAGDEENLPMFETRVIDVNDLETVTSYTGLSSASDVEYLLASEALISSIPYSLLVMRVKDGANVESIKTEVFENVDTRKWICVEASTLYATDYDNTVIFVMSDSELTNMMKTKIDGILGSSKGSELFIENEVEGSGDDMYEQEHLGDPVA